MAGLARPESLEQIVINLNHVVFQSVHVNLL